MTLSSETTKSVYTANGVTTQWTYSFSTTSQVSVNNPDVKLKIASPEGVETSIPSNQFTLDPVNKIVTYPTVASGLTPVADGYKVVVYRQVTANQSLVLNNSQQYTLASLGSAFDKQTMLIQDMKERLDRTPSWKISETPTSTEIEDLITDISNVEENTALALEAADRAEAAAITGLPYIHAITDIGCACNGTTDDYATLNAYFTTHTEDCSLFIPSRTLIGTSWTIPSNVKSIIFDVVNGQLSVPTTKTLTFTGQFLDCASNSFIFYGEGTYAGTITNNEVFPEWFGALGDASNDDTIPIQKAVLFGNSIHLTDGEYKIIDAITITSGKKFYGDNPSRTIIRQHTAGKPILIAKGGRLHIHDFFLRYNGIQTNEYSRGIHCQNLGESIIEKINIQYSYTGIYNYNYSSTDKTDVAQSYIYSCTIRDIRIGEYKAYGLYMDSKGDGNTGCVFENIYIVNWNTDSYPYVKRTATCGAYFKSFTESSVTQLNIEHTTNTNAILINNCETFVIRSVHMEGCDNSGSYTGLINIVSSSVSIDGMTCIFSDFTTATLYALFVFTGGGRATNVFIKNFQERDNTVTGGGSCRYAYVGTYSSTIAIYIDGMDLNSSGSIFAVSSLPSPTTNADPPMLRRNNDTIYYEKINGRGVYYLAAMPTTGTFAIGDRVINSSSSISQSRTSFGKQVTYGWLRLTASSNHVLNTDWVELLVKTKNQELPYIHAIANIGCTCDGSTNDYSTINSYFTTYTDDCNLFIPSTMVIGSDWSIPTNIKSIIFDKAVGSISISSSKTLTFTSQYIDAGMQTIFEGAGSFAGTISNYESYPQWFGALADDSNDDTISIRNALIVSNRVFVPSGTYKITDYINVASNKTLCGTGDALSIIKQYTAGKSILVVGGSYLHIYDLQLIYDAMQTNEYSHGIHFQVLLKSTIERVYIRFAYVGIMSYYLSLVSNADTTLNYANDIVLRNIRIQEYKTYGIRFTPFSNINNNCIFENINISNWDTDTGGTAKRTATTGAYLNGFSTLTVSNLKIGYAVLSQSILINNCDSAIINNLHIEGCDNSGSYTGFIAVLISKVIFDGILLKENDVTTATIYSLFSFSGGGRVSTIHIRNLEEKDNTLSGGGAGRHFYTGSYDSTIRIYAESIDYEAVFNTSGLPSPTTNADPPMLRRLNDAVYYQTVATRKQYYLTAMPTTGTFAIGDRVINTDTSIAESGSGGSKYIIYGWMRITASSNNVLNTDWVELRCLTGN